MEASRRRARRRWIVEGLLALVFASMVVDHFKRSGSDDWARFGGKSVDCVAVTGARDLLVRTLAGEAVRVRLLGVASCGEPGDGLAQQQLTEMVEGKGITLALEGTQTRDADGALLAYAYLPQALSVNGELIRRGNALADRRMDYGLRRTLEQAEAEASHKHVGIWNAVSNTPLPAWRLEWTQRETERQHRLLDAAAEQ